MPTNELEDRLRMLESAMGTVRIREPLVAKPDLARKFELAEKNVDLIVGSGALTDKEAKQFGAIADTAIKDSMRESLRGGAGETAATINVTVSGTGTISVS